MTATRTKIAPVSISMVAAALVLACSQNQPNTPQTVSATVTAPTGVSAAGSSASTSPAASAATAAKPGAASPSPSANAAASPSPAAAAVLGRWTFDTEPVGSVPAGAQVFSGQWAVRAEPDAPSPPNALCQTGQADFPAIGLDSRPMTDLTMTAKFKPISGREDQAGGLIFHVQDKDNYYIARANALEDNLIFFVYENARRSQLKSAAAKTQNGQWHDLRVDVRGVAFTAFLDGKQIVDVTDDRYKTGGIGLWTKSDSTTCFDDVQVTGA